MKILFTGGSGFLGRNLIPLLEQHYVVDAPSRKELNLLDSNALKKYIIKGNFDIIIHAAISNLLPGQTDRADTLLIDSLKTYCALLSLNKYYGKMIYFGSGAEFNKESNISQVCESEFGVRVPSTDYGLAKYIMNTMSKAYNNIINLRIFGCYGPTDAEFKFLHTTIKSALKSETIVIHKNCYFDYLYVIDIYMILQHFINHDAKFQEYNICSGNRYLLSDIAEKVKKAIPNCTSNILIEQQGLNNEYTGSNSRLLNEIPDIKLTDIDEGIKKYIRFIERVKI